MSITLTQAREIATTLREADIDYVDIQRALRVMETIEKMAGQIASSRVEPPSQRDYRRFFTPDDIADRMVQLLDPQPGDQILEPSAGNGSLVKALRRTGVQDLCIEAVEMDARHHEHLQGITNCVMIGDFLQMRLRPGVANKIIANPPFGNGIDLDAHVAKMIGLLKPGGRAVIIVPRGFREGLGKEHLIDNWARNSDGSMTAIKIIVFNKPAESNRAEKDEKPAKAADEGNPVVPAKAVSSAKNGVKSFTNVSVQTSAEPGRASTDRPKTQADPHQPGVPNWLKNRTPPQPDRELKRASLARAKSGWMTEGPMPVRVKRALSALEPGDVLILRDLFGNNMEPRGFARQTAEADPRFEFFAGAPRKPASITRLPDPPEATTADESTPDVKQPESVSNDKRILDRLLEAMPHLQAIANLREVFTDGDDIRRAATIADQDRRFSREGILVKRIKA